MRDTHLARALALALLVALPLAAACSSNDDSEGAGRQVGDADEIEAVREIPPREDPWIDPAADQVLAGMAAALQAAQRLSFRAETTTEEVTDFGYTIEVSATSDVALRRPSGLHVDKTSDAAHRHLFFDGDQVALFDEDKGLYATHEIAGTVSELIQRLHERFGSPTALSDLIVDDPHLALSEYADHAVYVGQHRVEGVLCDHIALSNDVLEWQLWVQAEGPPVPRKLVITYIDEPGEPTYRAQLSDWNLADTAPDSSFSFTPPEGAKRVRLTAAPDPDADAVVMEEDR